MKTILLGQILFYLHLLKTANITAMSILDKIKSFFSSETNIQDPALEEYDTLNTKNEIPVLSQTLSKATVFDESPVMLPIDSEAKVEWPSWLENDDLLRDEGVLFGLSDSKPDEKVAIIKNYFTHQTATLEREVERYGEKIQEINLFIEQRETRKDELKSKLVFLENNTIETQHQLLRTIVGLGFSVVMCIGNFFLIQNTLQPLYGNSNWIAVGVFLAGMFNLFGSISLFHEAGSKVSWRNLLEEVGMPLAASIFVFVQALQTQSVLRSIALFGFVFFLFLFAGKLLLSNLTLLHSDLRVWLKRLKSESTLKNKSQEWELENSKLDAEIDEFRIQKWQILPDLNRAEAELARLNARRDMLIKLFESEFLLARQLRNSLSQYQIKEFTRRFEE